MMNKKLVGTALVGLMTVGFAAQVSAATQVIDGNEGQNSAEVPVKGNLGAIDNTDPGAEHPEGDDKWINVTLPTATIFYAETTPGDAPEKLSSPNYEIQNNSGRPVKVSITNYDLKEGFANKALTELNIYNKTTKIATPLATEGASVVTEETEFAILADTTKEGNDVDFGFTGFSDPTKLEDKKEGNIDSTLHFNFKALDKNTEI
jgi:hypothetical protein